MTADRASIAVTLVRVAVAGILVVHGFARAQLGIVDDFGQAFGAWGFPFGLFLAWTITVVEIIGGLILAAGWAIRPLAIWFVVQLIAGIVLVHGREGWFVVGAGRNGVEFSVLLIVSLIAVALAHRAGYRLGSRRVKISSPSLIAIVTVGVVACYTPAARTPDLSTPQREFWGALQSLCGKAFSGQVVEGNASDSAFRTSPLRMHVRSCSPEEIRIPFHLGENRSRTWVITPTATGLRLKHDHRHEDGTEDPITQYGGDTRSPGTATKQEFYADSLTAALIPAARTNVWTVEVIPGDRFAYGLRREGTDRRFRVEFSLRAPIAAPPAPW